MTFIEKLQKEKPDFYNNCSPVEIECCMFGCPFSHGFEPDNGCHGTCVKCWHREIPEETTESVEVKKEKQEMQNIRELVETKVDDIARSGRIEEFIIDIVNEMDLDSKIEDLIDEEIRNQIEDYIGPVVGEAVRDAVRSALENLFN